jgi:hypothetical protein
LCLITILTAATTPLSILKRSYYSTTSTYNTATGYLVLEHNTAKFNTATGAQALGTNTNGNYNTAMDPQALNQIQATARTRLDGICATFVKKL